MKLDERIEKLSDILTCVDIEEAKQFIGQKGYFSDCIRNFDDLSVKTADVLSGVYDHDMTFIAEDDTHWRYFIPECRLKPKGKKYTPFTDTKEFFIKTNFEVGDLIHIRSKPHNHEYHLLIIGWTDEGLMLGNFSEMTFDELLQKFELWDEEEGNFIPLGVEDAE